MLRKMWSWEPQETAIYGALACQLHITEDFTLHDIERARFGKDFVEDVDVVYFAVADADKRGDIAVQIQQGMHFHRGFVLAKPGPREQGQAEIDGGRVQCIEALLQIRSDGILGIQRSRLSDQDLRKIGKDSPVARFVGVGQG